LLLVDDAYSHVWALVLQCLLTLKFWSPYFALSKHVTSHTFAWSLGEGLLSRYVTCVCGLCAWYSGICQSTRT